MALVVGALLANAAPAAACSVGPDWDRRAATEMFVLGRILSVEFRPHVSPPPKASSQLFQKVLTMQVDLVLKGPGVRTITFVDSGYAHVETLSGGGQHVVTWGGGGDCGAIEDDPRGRYGAFALGRWNGELYSSILLGAAFGSDAHDPAIARVLALHGLSLPATTTELPGADPALVAIVGLALLALPFIAWRAMRKSLRESARARL